MRRKICSLLIIVSLAIIIYIFFKFIFQYDDICSFKIQYEGVTISIEPWYNDAENKYYVFVPSFVDVQNLQLITNRKIYINNSRYNNLDRLTGLNINENYAFLNGDYQRVICFVKAENIATMFIETASNSLEQIHEDKNYKEKGKMTLINQKGEVEYNSNLKYIKGRGNSTWTRDKRPYNIQLSSKTDLLNMGKAKNWVLIANAIDRTHLRNKIVFDFANEIGLEYSPEAEYINLYINGEYKGLYLLCEKVEIATNRIDINSDDYDITGPYLLEKDLESRFIEEGRGFITNSGECLVIKNSTDMTTEKEEYIKNLWQKLEDGLYENDDDIFNIIDLDSWSKKYLLEEIFGNFDANNTSTFFYKKPDRISNLIYAGPVWDYDGACGTVFKYDNSKSYLVNIDNSMWNRLMQYDLFYNTVLSEYSNSFKSKIYDIINYRIDELSKRINNSVVLDDIRWNNYYNTIDTTVYEIFQTHQENIDYLKNFLSNRVKFLDSEWNTYD